MATVPVQVTLSTNVRKLEPASDFKLQDVLHCQIHVEHAVGVGPEQVIPKNVHKAVCQATKNYLDTETNHVMSTVNFGAFFVDPSNRAKLEHDVTNKFVILTIHHGKDQPPAEIADLDYESAWASDSATPSILFEKAPSVFVHTPKRGQWHRTQIITSTMSPMEINIAFQRVALAINAQQNRMSVHCHSVVVESQSLKVGSLLRSSAEGEDFACGSTGVEISLAAINELLRVIQSPTTLPTDSPSAQNSDGLMLLSGTSPILYRDASPALLVAEKSHVYVTPDPKPHTLAEFFTKQLASTRSTAERSAKLKTLGEMLKGVQVDVRIRTMHETHVATGLWDGNSQSAPNPLRHRAWTSKDEGYPLAEFPCLNVGSFKEPVLLPPELCTFLPGQDLRRGHTPAFSRLIEGVRRSVPPNMTAEPELLNGWSIERRQTRENTDNLQVAFERLGRALPRFLFLEAGTEDIKSSSWDLVRQLLMKRANEVSQDTMTQLSDDGGPLLSLRYDATSDVERLWMHQINRFVSAHESRWCMVTLIVYVQSDKQKLSSNMYNIIKKVCDVDVGIQSIFINHDTLETKSHNSPSQGPAQVVGSICRELRVRSPPMLTDMLSEHPNDETRNLVISMHVKSFTSQTPSLLDDWTLRSSSPEMILVTLVSRAVDSPADYHTEVKLFNKSDFEELDVPNLFGRFFQHIKNSAHNLIVLRSGYLVDALTKRSDDRLAEEKEAIRKAYKKIPHHGTFTYATLREDKLLKGCLTGQEATPQADKHSALLIATFGERPKTNPPRLWVFQNKGALDGSTGIKVTFLHHAADSASPSSRSIKRKLSQPQADNPTDGHHGDPPDASILDVAPVEVEILGQIWKDGHLELYDTKWPIPTHLAQLASDRALIHVVTNDWENQTETTPVYLTKVYKDVRNTLYYV